MKSDVSSSSRKSAFEDDRVALRHALAHADFRGKQQNVAEGNRVVDARVLKNGSTGDADQDATLIGKPGAEWPARLPSAECEVLAVNERRQSNPAVPFGG